MAMLPILNIEDNPCYSESETMQDFPAFYNQSEYIRLQKHTKKETVSL